MKTSKLGIVAIIGIIGVFSGLTGFAGSRVEQIYVKQQSPNEEVLIYLTGSHIPQRVRVWETGADTAWPLRIIGQHEIRINNTGQRGTADAFATEPSVRIIGR